MRAILTALPLCFLAATTHARGVSLDDVNFTGPLLTPGAVTLAASKVAVQPFLIYAETKGAYDSEGKRHGAHPGSRQWQTILPVTLGVTDRLHGTIIVGAAHNSSNGRHSDGIGATDTTAKLQYMVLAPNADHTSPAISISYDHRFPTGAYDRLDANPLNGIGNGANRDRFSFLTERFFWLSNDRPLLWRAQAAWSPRPSRVSVSGMSVHDTPSDFHGEVQLGVSIGLSTSLSYSIDRHWVLEMDAAWDHADHAQLKGWQCRPGTPCSPVTRTDPTHWVYSVAPAVEYNFSSSMSLIAGAQFSVAGHNNNAFLNPQASLHMVF